MGRIVIELITDACGEDTRSAILVRTAETAIQTPWVSGNGEWVAHRMVEHVRAAFPGVPLAYVGFIPVRDESTDLQDD